MRHPDLRRAVPTALAGLALCLLTACGSDDATPVQAASTGTSTTSTTSPSSSPGATTASAEATVHVSGFTYSVPESVSPGTTVSVMNMDGEAHTVTGDDGGFDVVVPAGETVTFTAPTEPGSYAFHCAYHSSMTAVLVVR